VRLRNLLLVVGVLGSMLGCQTPTAPAHPQRWAKAWINALNSHRGEQTSPLLRARGTYEDPESGGALSGLWLGLYLTYRWHQYPEMHFKLRQVTGDARIVVAEWSATGFSRTAGSIEGAFVLRVQDDHIDSVRGYYNALAVH
jgi:hypothetical protein